MWWLRSRRWYWKSRTKPGPLSELLHHPLPSPQSDFKECGYLAVDLETTGLNPKQDSILSIGYVAISEARLDLGTAAHQLVQVDLPIARESVTYHKISDDMAASGVPLVEALEGFLQAMCGRVLVAHHAGIELGFLSQACQTLYNAPFLVPTVDTLLIERKLRMQRQQVLKPGALRLAKVREHYHLPRYQAHHALIDAVSAGELFLAQASHMSQGKPLPLSRLLR